MAPDATPELVAFVRELAEAGGAVALDRFGAHDLRVDEKPDGSPVTEADLATERFLRDRLAEHHPDDALIGEEEGDVGGSTGRTWFLDPIDGTRAYARGVPIWATLVAVHDEHGGLAAAIALPALGEVVWAGRGRGAHVGDRPASVSTVDSLADAYVTTSGFETWPPDALLAMQARGAALRTWGDAYGYALVACGRVDVMVDPIVNPWDVAPMGVIVTEAGGRFTDLRGAEGLADTGLATNGRLHEHCLDLFALGPASG